jgi:hypothetical protein
MKQFVQESWKAIIAFGGVFISVLLARLSSGESPLPALDDFPAWLALVAGCFGTAILAYAKRNTLTSAQITHGFNALPAHEQQAVVQAVGPGPHA